MASLRIHRHRIATSRSDASSNGTCLKKHHFWMWLYGADECEAKPSGQCNFWKMDVKAFEDGKVDDECFRQTPPHTTTVKVLDYIVPKPKLKESHSATRKKGCVCDVCRYLDAGFEAFLEPSDREKAKKYHET